MYQNCSTLLFVLSLAIFSSVQGVAAEGGSNDDKTPFVDPGPHHDVTLNITEGTWMSVDVHQDKLVFDLLGDIWILPIQGGKAKQLTSGSPWDCQPRFSPDGQSIAYVSDRGGNEIIWIMPLDGGEAHPLVEEGDARLTQPVWDPSGEWIFARRRTVDTRSIGVTEIWQFHLSGGKGFPLTTKEEHPHAGEMAIDEKYVYFSDRKGRFEYNHNPYKELWAIRRIHRETGELSTVVRGSGSASRPTLSPDGKKLYFISRGASGTRLEEFDLETGLRKLISDDMSFDELEGFAIHGTYPSIAWHNNSLIYWANGKLWNHPIGEARVNIPFEAEGTWHFRTTERWTMDPDGPVNARKLRHPVFSQDESILAFTAMGHVYTQGENGGVKRISDGQGYFPIFSQKSKNPSYVTYDKASGGHIHFGEGRRASSIDLVGQPFSPTFSDDGTKLALLVSTGDGNSPDRRDISGMDLLLFEKQKRGWKKTRLLAVNWWGSQTPDIRISGDRIYFMEHRETKPLSPPESLFVSVDHQGKDKRIHINLGDATRAQLSPDGKNIAFQNKYVPYIMPMPPLGKEVDLEGALPMRRLATMGGDWISFTPSGDRVYWLDGATQKMVDVSNLPEAVDELPNVVDRSIDLTEPRARPSGIIALTNARLITMEGQEILANTSLIIEDNRIQSIGDQTPEGATVIDCTGKTIIPGFIDVHAHLHYTARDILPDEEWRYGVNLDFGVTTVHDPSANSDVVFTQGERVAAGFMKGPRVYSTGNILYGAVSSEGVYPEGIEDAKGHVQRMKRMGASSVKVYQQSQRERRQMFVSACHTEKILCVAEGGGDLFMDLSMISDGFHAVEHSLPQAPLHEDIQKFIAASHEPENSSGPAYTPTLLVSYGSLSGESYFREAYAPTNYPRLKRNYPPRELDADILRWGVLSHEEEWHFQAIAKSAAQLARNGALIPLGAHGQLQGLGVHWELWALASEGAMTPHEALIAATLSGAKYLGLQNDLGSLKVGKLADMLILEGDPLEDIHRSADIFMVIKNGEIVSK